MRLFAIMGGGDWADASVDHVLIPEGMDLDAEKLAHDEWYRRVYVPGLNGEIPKVEYLSLVGWLLTRGATKPGEDVIKEYWEL